MPECDEHNDGQDLQHAHGLWRHAAACSAAALRANWEGRRRRGGPTCRGARRRTLSMVLSGRADIARRGQKVSRGDRGPRVQQRQWERVNRHPTSRNRPLAHSEQRGTHQRTRCAARARPGSRPCCAAAHATARPTGRPVARDGSRVRHSDGWLQGGGGTASRLPSLIRPSPASNPDHVVRIGGAKGRWRGSQALSRLAAAGAKAPWVAGNRRAVGERDAERGGA